MGKDVFVVGFDNEMSLAVSFNDTDFLDVDVGDETFFDAIDADEILDVDDEESFLDDVLELGIETDDDTEKSDRLSLSI